MNTSVKTMAAVAILLAAGTASSAEKGTGQLLWDCGRNGAPSFDELRNSFGITNLHLASQTRVRLASRLAGACQGGLERVVLVDASAPEVAQALLARR